MPVGPLRWRHASRTQPGVLVGSDDPGGQLALARHAEDLGFDVVWAAEAYGSDSPTVLAWFAGQTSRIDVGAAVMQIPARTPGDDRDDGREP